MRKPFLIYNPASGQWRSRRARQIAGVVQVFRDAGIQPEVSATTHKGSAIRQTQEAISAGFDTIIACGGDGTANEALNGLMAAGSEVPLGVLPLGSGNLLATGLRLSSRAEVAARTLLQYQPRTIRPGVLSSQVGSGTQCRYFLVAAGIGSDAELMYRTAVEAKERWGRNAYFLEMARMALSHRMTMFQVEWEDEHGAKKQEQVSLAMAIRASRFPGLLQWVSLGSSLTQDHYTLLLFRTDKVRHFMNYFASVASGRNWSVPQVGVVSARSFRCTSAGQNHVHSQADGELLGSVPAEISIANSSFRLLMPARSV